MLWFGHLLVRGYWCFVEFVIVCLFVSFVYYVASLPLISVMLFNCVFFCFFLYWALCYWHVYLFSTLSFFTLLLTNSLIPVFLLLLLSSYSPCSRVSSSSSLFPWRLSRYLSVLLLVCISFLPAIHLPSFFPTVTVFQPVGLLPTPGIAVSVLPPLSNIPHFCLP